MWLQNLSGSYTLYPPSSLVYVFVVRLVFWVTSLITVGIKTASWVSLVLCYACSFLWSFQFIMNLGVLLDLVQFLNVLFLEI